MTTGWLLSCLLHGGLALATIFFVQRIHLAPQGDLFQWNVAMVATRSPSATTTAPVAQTTPPATHTPSSARAVQRIDSTPIAPAPASPPTEFAPPPQQMDPLLNESSTTQAIPAVPAHPLPEHASAPHADISPSPASPSDISPASDPLLSANTPVVSTSSQRSTNIDYGWLAALMAQWIEGLDKRYPAALRAEGIEGKVTLIALLREDGSLSNVRIAKGSGNAALDQVALEDVRNGPPVKFAHPLERPQISVKFSISYDLKTAR
jgi:periplasmic protein TonB